MGGSRALAGIACATTLALLLVPVAPVAARGHPPVADAPAVVGAAAVPGETSVCGGTNARVAAVLVAPAIRAGIGGRLARFESDLCADGYRVVERSVALATPPEVRAYLADLWSRTGHALTGAFLVGDIPHAYQLVTLTSSNPAIPSTTEETISYQYYTDLDGVFSSSAGYTSPGGHAWSFDGHTGAVDWELWVGVLPVYLGSTAETVSALNRYFDRNHAFRTGALVLPRGFLWIDELLSAKTQAEYDTVMAAHRSGQYAWTPLSSAPDARIYFDSVAPPLSVDQGYADLSAGSADIAVLDAHGNWRINGHIDSTWVTSHPVRSFLLWSDACAVGNLDHPDNFLAAALYSPTSTVLIAKGTTNNSGGMGTNQDGFYGHNVAAAIVAGGSVGEAVVGHVNVPLAWPWSTDREFFTATPVLLGDPTMRLRGAPAVLPVGAPSSLTLSASKPAISWGEETSLTARLTSTAGSVSVVGRTVEFEATRDGATWMSAASLPTDASGAATMAYRPSTNLWYRAVFIGGVELADAASAQTRVVVRQIALLRPDNAGKTVLVSAGRRITFTTTARPARPELPAPSVIYRVLRLVGRSWVPFWEGRVRTATNGTATLTWTFSTPGSWYVTSMAAPTPYNANSAWSAPQRYDVR